MQTVIIAGNVGNVKEVREVGGDKVLNFSLAVDNGKDKNGERRESTWWDCSLWGKRAESLAPYIQKGSRLTVQGRPSARAHEGKAYLGVTVNELTFMSSKQDSERGRDSEQNYSRETDTKSSYGGGDDDYSSGFATSKPSGPKESYDLDDDIPF